MVNSLETETVNSSDGLGNIREGIYIGNLDEMEEYSKKKEECGANGEHINPSQLTVVTDEMFGMHASIYGINQKVLMFCNYCNHSWERDINEEEHKKYHERQERWKEIRSITFDI